ncbi:MAG: ABC transporter permease [Mycoplasmatales bacterium]
MLNNKKIFLSLLGVIIGITLGSILVALTGNGLLTLSQGLVKATIGSTYYMGEWLMNASILILTGLSVAFAYRAGIFNIGAEGQFIVGSMVATIIGIIPGIPWGIHALLAVLLGTLAGALYGMIPGILKAYYRVNEVVVTIMLNWIALYYTNYLIANVFNGKSTIKTKPLQESASLGSDFLANLFDGAKMHYGFIFVILALVAYWFILEKTTYGFELKAVGFNRTAAKYSGINEKKAIISTLMISGAFAGLAGAIYALGAVDALSTVAVFRNYGFDGITIAFLGQFSAVGMSFAALLIAGLRSAGNIMLGVPKEIIDIVISIILLCSILIPVLGKKRKGSK